MEIARQMVREKPWYLNAVLLSYFFFLLLSLGMLGLVGRIVQEAALGLPHWYTTASIVFLEFQLLGVLLLWFWRKSGFYLTTVSAIGSEAIVVSYLSRWSGMLAVLIALGLLVAALLPVWHKLN